MIDRLDDVTRSVVAWRFLLRTGSKNSVDVEPLPPPKPTTSKNLEASEFLELIKWHIDRYDRLRSSTSTRASILLSAGSVILASTILLANYRLQLRETHPIGPLDAGLGVSIAITMILTLASISNCVNAIAARKTTRSLHTAEIPSRFVFNWGDTIKAVDGYTNFAERVANLDYSAILGHGIAELWTDILQHRRRHRYLRRGVAFFRYGVFALLLLTILTLIVVA